MEIYGTTTLEQKKKIESIGDVVATVRGRRSVVSAMGFEHKMVGEDVRLLAKAIDDDSPSNVRLADPTTQAWIDAVDWPAWPKADTVLGG